MRTKAWYRVEKMGLSYPELMYSHRCAWVAEPPRNFLTCLDQDLPVLESGDRSSSLTLFSGACVFPSVSAKRGTESRSLPYDLSGACLVFSLVRAKRGTESEARLILSGTCIFSSVRKSAWDRALRRLACPIRNLCILIGVRGSRVRRETS